MVQEPASALRGWEDYYLIVGSAAAALTGLQFVVITLIGEGRTRATTSPGGIGAFATPTIVHFCAALLVSVTICAPWPDLFGASIAVAVAGLAGLVYSAIVIMRALRQTAYEMVLEDRIWHITLPVIVYATLAVAGWLLDGHATGALFAIAGATLMLVYIGIHNAWDTSTFMVEQRLERERETAPATPVAAAPAAPVMPAQAPSPASDRVATTADSAR